MKSSERFINRELSWLAFNNRVLQEAADPFVPLVERLKFLGIYSNNLDEFFRVRVATYRRMVQYSPEAVDELGFKAKTILKKIREVVNSQREDHTRIYGEILRKLQRQNIHLINEAQLTRSQGEYVREYFQQHLRQYTHPILLTGKTELPFLDDTAIHLAIALSGSTTKRPGDMALIPVPVCDHSRFLVLPREQRKTNILLLDDVISFCLPDIFRNFSYQNVSAFSFKMTRDAELNMDTDISMSFLESISKSLKGRAKAMPVRFVYDPEMPKWMLDYFIKELGLDDEDDLVPKGRLHNFKDFISFPAVGSARLRQAKLPPTEHPAFASQISILSVIQKQDVLLHYPYHSMAHFLDFLREAALDPQVITIRITFYRVARQSQAIAALVNAARNGKRVYVYLELQARFDEEANIKWGQHLQAAGVTIIKGIPDIKVHAKLCLVTKKVKGRNTRYVCVGTGNFNEDTADLYTDHLLMTANRAIADDVRKLFRFLETPVKAVTFRNLIVSPSYMRNKVIALMNREIQTAKAGKEASILLKLNNLADRDIINTLYRAARAGVKVTLLVRSVCAVAPGKVSKSGEIKAYSLVGRFLEHTRIMIFHNKGEEKVYISSADLMVRNLDRRVEVICPILNPTLKTEICKYIEMQFADNVKLRRIGGGEDHLRPGVSNRERYVAQEKIYEWLRNAAERKPGDRD